jgi:TonB-linked SusC/RagA family outer membrane protein
MKKKWFNDEGNRSLFKWLRVMKLTMFILLATLVHVSASVYSQQTKLSMSLQNASVREVLKQIEDQSDFFFLYKNENIDVNRVVSVDIKEKSVEYLLDQIFKGTTVTYEVVNRQIVLVDKEKGEFSSPIQQQKSVTGKVTDTSGAVLPGVSVVVKGTTNGTVTDGNGRFAISNISEKATISFSFVGMKTQEVVVGNKTNLTVALEEETIGIEEVVAVGYGVQKKSDVISSVASVKAEKLAKVVSLDVGEMLRGKAAGVRVTTSDAGPGGSSNIQIRGKGSLAAGTSPIVIADGVEIGAINDINPGDISSVEILKDAAAQAIYGARASNGVILITTKRGKAGETKVNYTAYYGITNVHKNFDVYTPEEFAQMKREAYRTNNKDVYGNDNVVFSAIELASLQNKSYIDWEKIVIGSGSIQNHDLSIIGGTEKTKFFFSANYQNLKGVVPNTDFNKGMIRFNLDQTISSWLKFGLNSSLSITKSNDPGVAGVLNEVVRSSPLGLVYNDNGTLRVHPTGFQENWNPLNDLQEVSLLKNSRNDMVNIFLEATPLKGMTYKLNVSRRSWNYRQDNYSTVHSNAGYSNGMGSGSLQFQDNNSWTLDNILSYAKNFDNHHLSTTLIQSINEVNSHYFQLGFPQVPNDLLGVYGLESALAWAPSISGSQRRLLSYAGRVQYDYASKYYITVSGRRDGSSVFGKDTKWGFFPAVAIGWNIYKESFLSNFKPLTNLKLKASYGSVGNEAIQPYGSLASADQWDYMVNGVKLSGFSPGSLLPNPSLKWETSTTLNTAIDFGFFDNRISGTVEYYNTSTTDLLVNRNVNAATGYSTIRDNIGEIRNTGVELQMDGQIIRKKDFTLGAGIIFSTNKNQIVKLFGDLNGDGAEDDYPANSWFIGKPINVFYDFIYDGIWQVSDVEAIKTSAQPTAKPGEVRVKDVNGDKKLDNADREIVSQMPKWLGSFNLNAKYKGFDFSADISTVQGVLRYNKYLADYAFGGDLRGLFNGIKVDYWTPENPGGYFPRPTNASTPGYLGLCARQDASFVKLSTISLGYTLPAKLISNLRLNSVRIYCTGQNLYTLTKYDSYNPEQDSDAYPETRTISFGVQAGF